MKEKKQISAKRSVSGRSKALKYDGLELPENLNHILEQDFWMLDNISGEMLTMLHAPMKFTSTTAIFVRKGRCRAEINLQQYDIEGPCIVTIASSEILQPLSISEDFEGAFAVMSDRFVNSFKNALTEVSILEHFKASPIFNVSQELQGDIEVFLRHIRTTLSDAGSPYVFEAVLHFTLSFFYQSLYKMVNQSKGEGGSTAKHITNTFLRLARENFKKERFMEFYANEMKITPKHLGRTIKSQTGYTAAEWLDRLVILEAKVLLKSTNMTIQQIAEELNFTSQSFFGKYFKNIVGISPKEFRNGSE